MRIKLKINIFLIINKILTNRLSLPSNFRGAVNKTVLAGIFRPMANVSVAYKTFSNPSPNKISIVSFKIGNRPETYNTTIKFLSLSFIIFQILILFIS